MYKMVLIRHGQSQWNLENRFTGWRDVDLTQLGIEQAQQAGRLLKEEGFKFDLAFTSYLKRAIRTLWIVLDEMDQMYVSVVRAWQLNERHYGSLQGLNKSETAQKYGEEQVQIWRRSFSTPPPLVELNSEDHPHKDPRYKRISNPPLGESLSDTCKRVIPYWENQIAPSIKEGKSVIIAAHGNSLRALVKHLDSLNEAEILELNIPTGIPLVYELDQNLNAYKHYYLGDLEKIQKEMEAVANQGKAK